MTDSRRLLLAIGTLAAAAAALLALVATPGWQADQAALEAEALSLQRAARDRTPPPDLAASRRPAEAVAARLRAADRVADRTADRMADLIDSALRHDLQVASTRQRISGAHVELQQPVTGRYVDVRRFVESALRPGSGLALVSMRLERTDPDASLLRADLQWQLTAAPDVPGAPR